MTFRLGTQTYALPIEPIVQIVEMVAITPIPQVDEAVEGVINVRGEAVPVVNLRRHFNLPEVPLQLRTPIILVRIGERTVGLIVDEVIDVLSLSADQIARIADILPEGLEKAQVLQGVVHVQGDAVLLLDLRHIFQPYQAQALAEAVAALPDEEEYAEEDEGPREEEGGAEEIAEGNGMEEGTADAGAASRSEVVVEEVSQEREAPSADLSPDEMAREDEA